jgi:hypothetical protein
VRGSHRQAELRGRLQDHVPERVLAAAALRPRRAGSTQHAPCQLPADGVWLAVSATRLYAFAARGTDDVGDLLEVWDRDATAVRRAGRLTVHRVVLRVSANGDPVELDAPRWRAGQHTFFRYLLDPTRTA